MQLEPWQYQDNFLMVKLGYNTERTYVFLADHMTQADVVQHMIKHFTTRPHGFEVMMLDEESYDLLEPVFRKQGTQYILED